MPVKRPATERFWEKVDRRGPEECWEWTAGCNEHGYGLLSVNGRQTRAHRFSFELHVRPLLEGEEIDHRCHNRACVNPAHLDVSTREQNLLRRRFKVQEIRRQRWGVAPPITLTLDPYCSAFLLAEAARRGVTVEEALARALDCYASALDGQAARQERQRGIGS